MRFLTCGTRASGEKPNIRMRTPGRPSGVSSGESSRSMPHSAPQPMTDVPKPQAVSAAMRAHFMLSAVMIMPVPDMPKASANVWSIETPLTRVLLMPCALPSAGR